MKSQGLEAPWQLAACTRGGRCPQGNIQRASAVISSSLASTACLPSHRQGISLEPPSAARSGKLLPVAPQLIRGLVGILLHPEACSALHHASRTSQRHSTPRFAKTHCSSPLCPRTCSRSYPATSRLRCPDGWWAHPCAAANMNVFYSMQVVGWRRQWCRKASTSQQHCLHDQWAHPCTVACRVAVAAVAACMRTQALHARSVCHARYLHALMGRRPFLRRNT